MGLHAKGGRGVKPQLLTKHWSDNLFRMYHDLHQVPQTIDNTPRSRTSAAIDGNVVLCRTPQDVTTLKGWVSCFASQIMQVIEASAINVVVFDEPENLTEAKKAEQDSRDAAALKGHVIASSDCPKRVNVPEDDNYLAELLEHPDIDIHDVKDFRAARSRLFDEIVRRGFGEIMARIHSSDKRDTVLIIDGLDRRGAHRPVGERRNPQLYGMENCTILPHMIRSSPIGEGDLKLAWVQDKIRHLVRDGTVDVGVHLTLTIDTDSFAIELIEEGRRRCEDEDPSTVAGILCLYEKSAYCLNRLKHASGEETKGFLVCNYAGLYDTLLAHLWNQSTMLNNTPPTRHEERCSINFMAAGWVLSGCDFCDVNGMTAELVLEALPAMLAQPQTREMIRAFNYSWGGGRKHLQKMIPALQYLVRMCSSNYEKKPRSDKVTVYTMKSFNSAAMKRSVWTIAYWNGNEKVGNIREFGFFNDEDEINRLQYRRAQDRKLTPSEDARLEKLLSRRSHTERPFMNDSIRVDNGNQEGRRVQARLA